jgi:hypothetical protein
MTTWQPIKKGAQALHEQSVHTWSGGSERESRTWLPGI